jgi:hypothetical protein
MEKNKHVKKFTFFSPLFPIAEELHHLRKAMGGDSTSPWHKQCNGEPICHLEGDGNEGSIFQNTCNKSSN